MALPKKPRSPFDVQPPQPVPPPPAVGTAPGVPGTAPGVPTPPPPKPPTTQPGSPFPQYQQYTGGGETPSGSPFAGQPGPLTGQQTGLSGSGVILDLAGGASGQGGGGGQAPGGAPPPPGAAGTPPPPGNNNAVAQWAHNTIDPSVSVAQWEAWSQFYDPTGCPSNTPYHSAKDGGDNACVEKPDNCPPGKQAWGPNQCVSGDDPRVGGGGAGGPGGGGYDGGPSGGPGGYGAGGGDLNSLLQQRLRALLGGETRYTPEVLQGIMGNVKSQAEAQAGQQSEAALEDAARRGTFRSAIAGRPQAQIRANVGATTGQAYSQLLQRKAETDFEDKSAALDRTQRYLDSLKQAAQFQTMTAQQRAQFNANLQMAYAQLQAQFDLNQQRAALGGLGF